MAIPDSCLQLLMLWVGARNGAMHVADSISCQLHAGNVLNCLCGVMCEANISLIYS